LPHKSVDLYILDRAGMRPHDRYFGAIDAGKWECDLCWRDIRTKLT
jgi:hypothetical protein